jgi:hypothetical protein
VNDGSAREVERAHVGEPPAAPHPVRDRRVDHQRPQDDEDEVGREAHAFDNRARDQGRRDDAERALIRHEQVVGDGALRLETDAAQEQAREVAEVVIAGRERQRIADNAPEGADESERDKAHHHRIERVFRTDEPAVEKREGWRHEEDQRG